MAEKIDFGKLSPEEYKKFEHDFMKEWQDHLEWYKTAMEKRKKELRESGEWITSGLDSNQEKLRDIIDEQKQRFLEIKRKYIQKYEL